MSKRLKFKCWNCSKTYTLYKEITDEQTLIVACPFCSKEAVVDLKPFRKPKASVSVLKDILERTTQETEFELQLPETILTQKPE